MMICGCVFFFFLLLLLLFLSFLFVFVSLFFVNDFPETEACRRNLVLTDSLAFAIDFWMLPRYIPEHFGIFPKFNDGRR